MRLPFLCAHLLTLALVVGGPTLAQTGHEHHHPAEAEDHAHHDHAASTEADDPHAHHRAMMEKPPAPAPAQAAKLDFKDLPLLDQDGQEVRLISDVIGDRIVVMNFVYTTCTTVCPVLTALFTQVQDRLGEHLGKDVLLVSMTVDPIRDTPERLKAYAEERGARPGWVWLTGAKPSVESVLEGLGAYSPRFEDHPAMVLVGDGRAGQWQRFFGFPSPDRVMEQVDALLAARQASGG